LTPYKRKHTLISIDAGGGTIAAINELLSQDYAVVTKEHSAQRASRLVKSVKAWVEDPEQPGRMETLDYALPVRWLSVRAKSSKDI
jgi:hypothetical protein